MSTQPTLGQIAAEKLLDQRVHHTNLTLQQIAQIIDSVIDSASLPAAGNHKPDEDGVCEACGMDLIYCEPVKISTQPVQGLEQIAREAFEKYPQTYQTFRPEILRACQAAASQARL